MTRTRLRNFLFAALLLLPVDVAAQSDSVDDFIRAELKRQNIPGLSLAVIKDGRIIKAQGYGFANVKLQTPATSETVYRIASVSKQFIATGILLLVQDGKLTVDDRISKYLEDAPAAWSSITIRHALAHTAGLVREAPGYDWSKIQPDAAVLKSAYAAPLHFAPGEKYQYSNVGYFALAEIIRIVSSRPWAEFIDERVFRPSGMSTTYPTNTKASLPTRSASYIDNDNPREVQEWVALRPSGAFLSTVLDMAKWDAVLYTDKILTDATRRQMWTAVQLNDGTTYPYGFGWELGSFRGRKLVHHGGGGPGIRTKFARFVDERLSIVILINLDDVDIDTILYGIASHYVPATGR